MKLSRYLVFLIIGTVSFFCLGVLVGQIFNEGQTFQEISK